MLTLVTFLPCIVIIGTDTTGLAVYLAWAGRPVIIIILTELRAVVAVRAATYMLVYVPVSMWCCPADS